MLELRCEWGEQGIAALRHTGDVVIVVDVLSFCTAVDIAVSRGAAIFPYGAADEPLEEYAHRRRAQVAEKVRVSSGGYSLSPSSLVGIKAGERLVLPSPNGGSLSLLTGRAITFAGCLRNRTAVAQAAQAAGASIAVIPAGERWRDGSLRPAVEDWLGAGAILAAFDRSLRGCARAAGGSLGGMSLRARIDRTRLRKGCGTRSATRRERDGALPAGWRIPYINRSLREQSVHASEIGE